jgi:branched-chain amino acid transport system permease protein
MSQAVTYAILGLSIGAIYAVAASGLVVTYTTSGIFNFAHGAIGMIAAFVYWQLRFDWQLSAPVAIFLVIFVFAPLFGAFIELVIMRGLATASETTRVVVSVGLLSSLVGAALWIWDPQVARPFPVFFGPAKITILGTAVTVHEIITMACAVIVAVALAGFIQRTRVGVDMRAVVDNRPLLLLNGGRPDRVAMVSWAIGCSLAALAGVLIAPTLQLSVIPLTLLVINAYAAAVIGRLRSLPWTFVGAIFLGLVESFAVGYIPFDIRWLSGIRPAIPVIILFFALLLIPHASLHHLVRRKRDWFPAPRLRVVIAGGVALVAATLLIGPSLDGANLFTANRALALGVILLSMVPLIGYANQLSLCQLSFGAVGAITMAHMAPDGNPFGLVAAFGVAALVGALMALPALRLRGIYLALATAAFAVMLDRWLFTLDSITIFGVKIPLFGIGGAVTEPRVHFLGISFTSDAGQLVLTSIVFGLFALLVVSIRRSSYGRMLLAMRDSEAACATLGLRLTTTKLSIFALSAGMAGVGGALLAGVYTTAQGSTFTFFEGLPVLLLGVVGGIGAVSGVVIGTILLGLFEALGRENPSWIHFLAVLPGLAGIGLARNPGGLASDFSNMYYAIRGRLTRSRAGGETKGDVGPTAPHAMSMPSDTLSSRAGLG